MVARRKKVLFIVEGPSDKEALEVPISSLYKKVYPDTDIIFKPFRGDITTNKYKETLCGITKINTVSPEFFARDIYSLVIKPLQNEVSGMYPKCIEKIFIITDTDGAYIPDSCLEEDKYFIKKKNKERRIVDEDKKIKAWYEPQRIICDSKKNIIKRNIQKRKMLDYLSTLNEIQIQSKVIPIKTYYFSCNLDHFLHNEANLDFYKKNSKAEQFYSSFIGNDGNIKDEEFKNYFVNDLDSSVGLFYDESWNFIRQDLNSLSRHTNLDLLIYQLWEEGNKK